MARDAAFFIAERDDLHGRRGAAQRPA